MEKKKLLLVAISVGIFLVIAIVAAIMVFTPKNAAPPSPAMASRIEPGITALPPAGYLYTPEPFEPAIIDNLQPAPSVSVDAVDILRTPGETIGLRPAPEGINRQGNDFYVSGTGSTSETVINVSRPSAAVIPEAPSAPIAATPAPVAAAPRPAPAAPAPKPAAPVVSTPAVAPSATAASRPAVVQTKVYDDYWVQTGAFSTIARAEGVKDTLASKGITSIIENRDVDGRTVFRVRVGPYTSQSEADYWLSLIKTISGFEESQVRLTQSRR